MQVVEAVVLVQLAQMVVLVLEPVLQEDQVEME